MIAVKNQFGAKLNLSRIAVQRSGSNELIACDSFKGSGVQSAITRDFVENGKPNVAVKHGESRRGGVSVKRTHGFKHGVGRQFNCISSEKFDEHVKNGGFSVCTFTAPKLTDMVDLFTGQTIAEITPNSLPR